jgi:hypothetical protein
MPTAFVKSQHVTRSSVKWFSKPTQSSPAPLLARQGRPDNQTRMNTSFDRTADAQSINRTLPGKRLESLPSTMNNLPIPLPRLQ